MPGLAEATVQRIAALDPFPQPSFIRLRYPVVLMHGFGMLASFRRGGHLHDEALSLRLHGVPAFAPNVAPYNTVPIRAEMWKQRIETILLQTGAERVNLIAQSMGGLDARYLISRMGMHEHVASLVTISTPHHGSPIASIALKQPELLQGWVNELCNWLGSNALADCPADFLTTVRELTPEYICGTFNPAVPDHPDVRYWSYAGAAGKGTKVLCNPFLKVLNTLLYAQEGVNDCFVSVESAKWGTFMGTLNADHAGEVGIRVIPSSQFDSNGFYREVVQMLAGEGF